MQDSAASTTTAVSPAFSWRKCWHAEESSEIRWGVHSRLSEGSFRMTSSRRQSSNVEALPKEGHRGRVRWITFYIMAWLLVLSCDLVEGQDRPGALKGGVDSYEKRSLTPEIDTHVSSPDDLPDCTVDQLLPNPKNGPLEGWMQEPTQYSPPYNCSCPYYKARYFCPRQPLERASPVWRPHHVANGNCAPVTVDRLRRSFLPDDYTVFTFANSHGRQLVESLLCRFSDQVVTRNVTTSDTPGEYGSHRQQIIAIDSQCRGMSTYGLSALAKSGCISKTDGQAFKCKDDQASFQFKNGASLHYRFSDMPNKSVDREMASFGLAPSDVDVVIMNVGNGPQLSLDSIMSTAKRFKGSGALLAWLTMNDGRGHFRDLDIQRQLAENGVIQVDISVLAKSELVQSWRTPVSPESTKYTVDYHFCMPGPADEMALLLTRLVWAHYLEKLGG